MFQSVDWFDLAETRHDESSAFCLSSGANNACGLPQSREWFQKSLSMQHRAAILEHPENKQDQWQSGHLCHQNGRLIVSNLYSGIRVAIEF